MKERNRGPMMLMMLAARRNSPMRNRGEKGIKGKFLLALACGYEAQGLNHRFQAI